MAKIIEGTCEKIFALINTTAYNGDGKYCVQVIAETELEDMGFQKGVDDEVVVNESICPIKHMEINDVATTDYYGCLLIRIG